MRARLLALIALLAACSASPAAPPPKPATPTVPAPSQGLPSLPPSVPWPCAQEGDVNGDGHPDRVRLDATTAAIEVHTNNGPKTVAISLPAAAITRVCLGQLDDSGQARVVVGVVRPTTKDGTFRQRIFVYRYEHETLRSHFLGTEAGGWLQHFGVADLDEDGRDEVVARELTDEGPVTRAYTWEGFGFRERKELAEAAPAYQFHPPTFENPRFEPPPGTKLSAPTPSWTRTAAQAPHVEVRRGLGNVANLHAFRWLHTDARNHIENHGFVVVTPPAPPPQFHSLYIENQYLSLPSFVSADAALHFTHMVFDDVLQDVEQHLMGPVLTRFVGTMCWQATYLRDRVPGSMTDALDRVLLRLRVAESVLTGSLDSVPPPLRSTVQAELDAMEQRGPSPAHICDGYGNFVVRGHYTKTEALGRFFKAHLLLATAEARDPQEVSVLTALAVSDPAQRQRLLALDGLARALVGPAAAQTPLDRVAQIRDDLGTTPTWDQLATFSAKLASPQSTRTPDPILSVALLARRWPADNDLLADPERTSLPDPLELLAVLGSDRARARLLTEAADPAAMTARLDRHAAALRAGRRSDPSSAGGQWLLSLRWVLLPYPGGYPAFQRTDAWADHNMVSAAASWTELRRDTILHVQPPIVWAEGGDEDALPPGKAAYVEPVPELYRDLGEVLEKTRAAVVRVSDLPGLEVIGRSRSLLSLFEQAATQELRGQGLSREQHEQLRRTGEVFEEVLAGDGTLRLDPVPVIADVAHLHDPGTTARTSMLMAATGPLDVIVVAVPLGKRVILARGAVSSFHSFESNEMMTDEAWREKLEQGNAPPRPPWAQSVRSPAGPRPKPSFDRMD